MFCLTGCKDALVPKPIKLTCNINTFDAPISCVSRSTADADKLYIGQEDGCIIEKVNNNCQTYSINSNRHLLFPQTENLHYIPIYHMYAGCY